MNHTIEHRFIASYICKECGKEINSNKIMRIKKRTYHLTCGMNKIFGSKEEKGKICQKKEVILNG